MKQMTTYLYVEICIHLRDAYRCLRSLNATYKKAFAIGSVVIRMQALAQNEPRSNILYCLYWRTYCDKTEATEQKDNASTAQRSSLRCNQGLLELRRAALVRHSYWNCILRLFLLYLHLALRASSFHFTLARIDPLCRHFFPVWL